ncbi:MAG TPA: UrcA family protein [Steroidobacteraceae bacterium]|nr:UrcA family protein [Steroidobacteraceae bacterium]
MRNLKLPLIVLICGIAGTASAASAATADEEPLTTIVKYNPVALDSDVGALTLYRQLVQAAAQVCPQDSSSPLFLTRQVRECREQAVARAVFKINHPKLVAVYTSNSKHG